MRTLLSSAVVVGIFVAYTANVGLTQSGPSLEGVWLATTSGMDGKITNPKRLPGLIIQTEGYYSIIMQEGRNATASAPRKPLPPLKTPGQPTDAEKIARFDLWAPLGVQAGTYEVKGNMIIRHQMVSKNAVLSEPAFEFRFEDNGNTLVTTGANGATASYRRLE